MKVEDRLTPAVAENLRLAIAENFGNEIFVIGRLDREKRVNETEVAARGNQKAVPLLRSFVEKGEVVIHNHPGGVLVPSDADLAIASQLGADGVGFFIVDNGVTQVTVVAEPVIEDKRVLLATELLATSIMPGGRLSQIYSGYEEREAQVEMLRSVCRSFNQGTVTIVEAGTGVGKSLAYLIPAFAWVTNNRERVVISTATINLQQQLLEKDIPLVSKILGQKPKVALVKGRGNYVCLARIKETMEEFSLFEEISPELQSISEWCLTTKTGSRDDLSVFPQDDIWSSVCSEADLCLGLKCKMREDCFVIKARKEASNAQILVVNNHLLFSDLSIRIGGLGFKSSAVLPAFQRIIFDEAHNIEKSATSFFSEQFSKFALQRCLKRLYRKKGRKVYGLLLGLEKNGLKKSDVIRLWGYIAELTEKGDFLNQEAAKLLSSSKSFHLFETGEQRLARYLLVPLKELEAGLAEFINFFSAALENLPQQHTDEDILLLEIKIQLRRLMRILEICKQFPRFQEKKEMIFWLDSFKTAKGERVVRFVITPLDITAVMKKAVYEPYESLVFTSATLTVVNDFTYWKTRVGLAAVSEREIAEISLPSPFNYKEQALLCIPNNSPLPNEKAYQSFIEKTVLEIIELFEGRALVLFTSYEMLNSAYNYVKDRIKNKNIIILKQGDEDRHKLLSNFIRITNSALFATDSFWEGVDSPGETLSVVIICRLPFKVPTEPVTIARMEHIRQNGGNPFLELSLPEAVMRLRQGFGRLMRSKQDKGAVVILDSRIIRKTYGQAFIESLPEARLSIVEKDHILAALEDFMFA